MRFFLMRNRSVANPQTIAAGMLTALKAVKAAAT